MYTVHISTSVTKLGTAIPCVNLPPVITCRADAPCAKCAKEGGGCYAMKGHFAFPKVKASLMNNLKAYRENPTLYFETIATTAQNFRRFRYHSAGDIVDYNYLVGMCKAARKAKGCDFLCFTKKYELVNQFVSDGHRIPKNLHIVFSTWEDFIPENPYNFPTTWVKFADERRNEKMPKNAIPCGGKCSTCSICWNLKKGQAVYFKKH